MVQLNESTQTLSVLAMVTSRSCWQHVYVVGQNEIQVKMI